jgi:hypothetical protein
MMEQEIKNDDPHNDDPDFDIEGPDIEWVSYGANPGPLLHIIIIALVLYFVIAAYGEFHYLLPWH